jgi:hypothetical protein
MVRLAHLSTAMLLLLLLAGEAILAALHIAGTKHVATKQASTTS